MAAQVRDRLLTSAIRLGQRDGWSNLTVADVLAESGAARRSFYTHFPGGTKDLTVAAVTLAADWITAVVREACRQPSAVALADFVAHWRTMLETTDYLLGCPVAAAATSRTHHPTAADLATHAFEQWESQIAAALVRDGADPDVAERLALVSVAAIEGAVTRCVAAQSSTPLDVVGDHLHSTIAAALP